MDARDGSADSTDHHGDGQTQGCEGNGLSQAGRGNNARERADRHKACVAERQLTQNTNGQVERNRHDDIGTDRYQLTFKRRRDVAVRIMI